MPLSYFNKNDADDLFRIVQTQVTKSLEDPKQNGSSDAKLLEALTNFYECALIEEEEVSQIAYEDEDDVATVRCRVSSVSNDDELCASVKRTMLRVIKRFPRDMSILDYASKLLACCGSETSRTESRVQIRFRSPNSSASSDLWLRFSSPCFSAADVGFRLWASSKAFCAWMLHHPSDILESVQPYIPQKSSVVYLGCGAIPLTGITLAGHLGAEKLILSDMNQECLDVALSNCQSNLILHKPPIISTCKYNWSDDEGAPSGDIIIASACLYEDDHVEILPKAILRCFPKDKNQIPVILALHEEHPGFSAHYPDMFVRYGLNPIKTFVRVKVIEGERLSTIRIVLMMSSENSD